MEDDFKQIDAWIMQNPWTTVLIIVGMILVAILIIFVIAFVQVIYLDPKKKKEKDKKKEEPDSIRIDDDTPNIINLQDSEENEDVDEENELIERETYRGPQETEYIEKLKAMHLSHYKLYKCTEAYRNESHKNRYTPYPAYFYVIDENPATGNCAIVFESTFKGKASLIFIAKINDYENAIKRFGQFMASMVIKKREIIKDNPRYLYDDGIIYISRAGHNKKSWYGSIKFNAWYHLRIYK